MEWQFLQDVEVILEVGRIMLETHISFSHFILGATCCSTVHVR